MVFLCKPILAVLLGMVLSDPNAMAAERTMQVPAPHTIDTTNNQRNNIKVAPKQAASHDTRAHYSESNKESYYAASTPSDPASYDNHKAWQAGPNHDMLTTPSSNSTHKNHDAKETKLESIAWGEQIVKGLEQLRETPGPTTWKLFQTAVVSAVKWSMWIITRPFQVAAFAKNYLYLAAKTAYSSVASLMDVVDNAVDTAAKGVRRIRNMALLFVFDPTLRNIFMIWPAFVLAVCSIFYGCLALKCLFCFQAPNWSKLPKRVILVNQALCPACLFIALSFMVNIDGQVQEEHKIPISIFFTLPALLVLCAWLVEQATRAVRAVKCRAVRAVKSKAERIFVNHVSETYGINHLHCLFMSMGIDEQRNHAATFLKLFATMPCKHSDKNVTHLWCSMAACATPFQYVDEALCHDIAQLMGPDALRRMPPMQQLSSLRVTPANGNDSRTMFSRPVHGADFAHWMAHKTAFVH